MSKPFFSIIIPTYNRAHLLPKAIESVLAQKFNNWELIIIDDGSTDDTEKLVRGYIDSRIVYIYQTNAERSAARNNGISHARADYICFLDSDDYYLPERLLLLHTELTSRGYPVAMFYTALVFDMEGKLYPSESKPISGNLYDGIATSVIHSQQTCISRKILFEFKYDPQFRIVEDMELWLRIAQKYPVIYLEHQDTIVVVNHDDRSVNVMRYNNGEDQLRLYAHIFSASHSGLKISDDIKSALLSAAHQSIAKYYIYQGSRFRALHAILKSIYADRKSRLLKFRINVFIKLATFYPYAGLMQLMQY